MRQLPPVLGHVHKLETVSDPFCFFRRENFIQRTGFTGPEIVHDKLNPRRVLVILGDLFDELGFAVGTIDSGTVDSIRTNVDFLQSLTPLAENLAALNDKEGTAEIIGALIQIGGRLEETISKLEQVGNFYWSNLGTQFTSDEFTQGILPDIGLRLLDLGITTGISNRSRKARNTDSEQAYPSWIHRFFQFIA